MPAHSKCGWYCGRREAGIKNALQEGKKGYIRRWRQIKRQNDLMKRLVQLLFYGLGQFVLVVANPLRQDVVNDSPMAGIAFFHAEHDAVAPVVTYVNREKRVGSIGNTTEIEFF